VLSQVSSFKLEHGILGVGREDGERRFAASFAKFACAAQNAEPPYRSDLGKLDQASKNNVPLIEDSRAKAVYEGVLVARLFRNANDRTSSRASAHLIIVLVEQLDTDDEYVADRGLGEIAGECLLYDLRKMFQTCGSATLS
jgi:hypothetical protein